jgi:hypothetical protein
MAMPSAGNRRGGRSQRNHRGKPRDPGIDTQTLQYWAQGNPLWEWRARNKVTRPEAAVMLGVGATTIWQWENGAARPRKEHMAKLVGIIGPDAVERWLQWLASKPKVV